MSEQKYLHGFDKKEQKRLLHQAQFLESYVYKGVDLEQTKLLLEVGCGVGAQTKILLKHFPQLKIHSVDISNAQINTAKDYLKNEIKNNQVELFIQDAQKLKMPKAGEYEAAFLCWFLEHIPSPLEVLKRVKNQLKPGGKIYCSEVFNQTLFMEPYSPTYLKYWSEFNDYQWSIGGHPFIGITLGNLLKSAGFVDIELEMRPFHFDSRNAKERSTFIDYFFNILLSAEKYLVKDHRITPAQIKKMKQEVARVKKTKDSVFFYSFVRATAKVSTAVNT